MHDVYIVERVYTDLEPGEHEFPRWEFGFAYLVSDNERPYQTKDQLEVAVHDVHVALNRGIHYLSICCINSIQLF